MSLDELMNEPIHRLAGRCIWRRDELRKIIKMNAPPFLVKEARRIKEKAYVALKKRMNYITDSESLEALDFKDILFLITSQGMDRN